MIEEEYVTLIRKVLFKFITILEILAISIGLGWYFENWAIGIGVFFVLVIILSIKVLRLIFSIVIASVCSYFMFVGVGQDLSLIENIVWCATVWLLIYLVNYYGTFRGVDLLKYKYHNEDGDEDGDAWCYNNSKVKLERNIRNMLNVYNSDREHVFRTKQEAGKLDNKITLDKSKISWTPDLKRLCAQNKELEYKTKNIRSCLYRPFFRTHMYYSKDLNWSQYRMPTIFPRPDIKNIVIAISGSSSKPFSAIASDCIIDFHILKTSYCFPRWIANPAVSMYKKGGVSNDAQWQLVINQNQQHSDANIMVDGLSDNFLATYQKNYSPEITKDDLFYYIYGLLHSPDYRLKYQNNLVKSITRIPAMKEHLRFMKFSNAGRELAELHINYETVEKYPVVLNDGVKRLGQPVDHKLFYRVQKMRFATKKDKTTIIYNGNLSLSQIPLEAYDYIVNNKSAIEWVMDRQGIRTDKESGIVNDSNDYANETMSNPAYPLELLQRVITVSLETNKIVRSLPELDI